MELRWSDVGKCRDGEAIPESLELSLAILEGDDHRNVGQLVVRFHLRAHDLVETLAPPRITMWGGSVILSEESTIVLSPRALARGLDGRAAQCFWPFSCLPPLQAPR